QPSERHMGRSPFRLAMAVTVAAVVIGSSATASFASVEGVTHPAPVEGTPGHYIVMMKADPLATYEGDTKGLRSTKPKPGNQLDAHSQDSRKYIAHLKNEQRKLAQAGGITPDATYQVT